MRDTHQRGNGVMRSLLVILALAMAAVPAAANAWWQKDWSYRKEITLDASSKGGSILQPAGRVPVPSPGLQTDELALLVGPPATFWLCVWCVVRHECG